MFDYYQEGNGIVGDVSDRAYLSTMKKMKVKGLDNLEAGEKHAPLRMPDGSFEVGNYIGPGTQAVKRIHRGDRGKTPVDDLAMRHDAFYSLARTKDEIRKADEDFLKILRKGVVKDKKGNLKTGEMGIIFKYLMEGKTGVLFPSQKELDKNDPNDEKLKDVIRMTDKMYGVQSGYGLIGDIVKGFTKDPIGSLVSIGSVVQKKEVWDNADKFIREDETMQEIIKKTNDVLDKVKSVTESIPVISELSEIPFAGWDAFSDEYEQKDKSKQKPHLKNLLRDYGDWEKIRKKYPGIGSYFLETITKEFSKLGMSKYKQQLPRIMGDQMKRIEKYAKYKEVEVKEELKKLAKEQIKILEKGDDKAKELLNVIKSAPHKVSKELMTELSAEWENKNPFVTEARIAVWTKPKKILKK